MKFKIINILFLVIFATSYTFANITDSLNSKYINYRNRLLNEWVIISSDVEQFGVNIPAVDRRLDKAGNISWVSWSDGNSNFNHWLGLLSTEYRLLKNNNQDYQETLSMLFYAMIALERLDLYSEYTLRKYHKTEPNKSDFELIKYPEDINGFLIRDDVSLGFWKQYYKHFNEEYGKYNKIKNGTNRYLSIFQKGVIPQQGMSQDNIVRMLQGLALVKKLVDDEDVSKIKVKFRNDFIPNYLKSKGIWQGNTISFKKWIDDLTDRLVRQCHQEYPQQRIVLKPKNEFKARPSQTRFGALFSSYWYIMNPVTNDLVAEGNGEDMGVWINSYGFGEAGKSITGNDIYHYDNSHKGLAAYVFKSILFKNLKILWLAGFPMPENFDDYMFRDLASISDINWNTKSYDLLFLLSDKRNKYTYEHCPLILVTLHNQKYQNIYKPGNQLYENDKIFYQQLLSFAPFSGPSSDTSRNDYHPYWSASSRLVWPNNEGNKSSTRHYEYVGMDYMFLYNLYRLVFEPNNYSLKDNTILKTKTISFYPSPELDDEEVEYFYLPPEK